MGLTINYSLQSGAADAAAVHGLLEELRSRALDLPLANVGRIVEFHGAECNFEVCRMDDPHRWLLIQAGTHVELTNWHFRVLPTHVIAFTTLPGEGCEPANFGLCRYPASITVDDPNRPGARRRLPCSGAKWRWSSFCKTQYASDPQCGGVENFLKCHLSVVAILDRAKALGILGEVADEGRYWDHRDAKQLAANVGQWNELIAGFVGRFKDEFGDTGAAPIAQYPNFEHLEARGRKGEK